MKHIDLQNRQYPAFETNQLVKETNSYTGHRMQIQGHRGGYLPENTMASFEKAIENCLEAIELDVWMTKDGIPIILHGGDNGELNHHFDFDETLYIFDKTYDELLVHDVGEGQRIPTLENLISFIDKRLFINIEVKAPHDKNVKVNYDYKDCITKVHEQIRKYQIEKHCWVSSFDYDVLEELENLNSIHSTNVDTIYLYNFYDTEELPDPSVYTTRGSGINISSTKLTPEVILNCHEKGKKVGVWIDRSVFNEDEDFYKHMINMKVDFFCTDFPNQAHNCRNDYYMQIQDSVKQPFIKELVDPRDMSQKFDSLKTYSMSSSEQYFADGKHERAESTDQSDNSSSNFNSENFISSDHRNSPELLANESEAKFKAALMQINPSNNFNQ